MYSKTGWLKNRLKEVKKSETYSSGEYSDSTTATGTGTKEMIKLNSNENILIPLESLSGIFKEVLEDLDPRTYPQNEKMELVKALSNYLDLPSEYFTIGNGSDELIETILTAFIRQTEKTLSIMPTFSMYKIITESRGKIFEQTPLGEGFSLDPGTFLSKVTSKTVMCILCSPNNPTGNQFNRETVTTILKEFKGLVLLDEAYVEFAPFSLIKLIKDFDNLIILRTFSKIFGLAGLRIGYSVASPNITSLIRKIQLPWNVNKFSMRMATKMLEKKENFLQVLEIVKKERKRLIKRLNRISGVEAFKSDANFVLFKTNKDADAVFNELRNKGILIRSIAGIPRLNKCLRVTIGLPTMNDQFIKTLQEICGG